MNKSERQLQRIIVILIKKKLISLKILNFNFDVVGHFS